MPTVATASATARHAFISSIARRSFSWRTWASSQRKGPRVLRNLTDGSLEASGTKGRRPTTPKRHKGFSAVEVVVGIAILLVIAAIAIPNLLHSNLSENESAAVASLRSLNNACENYARLYGGFPKSLSKLGPGTAGGSPTPGLASCAAPASPKEVYCPPPPPQRSARMRNMHD